MANCLTKKGLIVSSFNLLSAVTMQQKNYIEKTAEIIWNYVKLNKDYMVICKTKQGEIVITHMSEDEFM